MRAMVTREPSTSSLSILQTSSATFASALATSTDPCPASATAGRAARTSLQEERPTRQPPCAAALAKDARASSAACRTSNRLLASALDLASPSSHGSTFLLYTSSCANLGNLEALLIICRTRSTAFGSLSGAVAKPIRTSRAKRLRKGPRSASPASESHRYLSSHSWCRR